MRATVTIRYNADDSRLERFLFGSHWWSVRVPGHGSKSGFARNWDKAMHKAVTAGEELLRTVPRNAAEFIRHEVELSS